jgi:hypothetical protein
MNKPEIDIEHEKRQVAAQSNQKPLDRDEIRRREAVNKEVQATLAQSSQKFLTFFLNSEDPEGKEVVERMETLDAQWRTFCKRKHLIPAAYPLLKQEMNGIIQDYIKEKERGKETTEQPQPIE